MKNNNELVVKYYPRNKKQMNHQQRIFKQPDCPSCKRNKWLEFENVTNVKNANTLLISKNIKLIKKFLDKIITFLLGYHMLIKTLEKYVIQWLILLIIH